MEKYMSDSELNIYGAIKAPMRTKLEEILRLLKKDDLLSFAEDFGISGRSRMNKENLVEELYKQFQSPGYLEDSLLAATNEELSIFRKLLEVPYSEIGEATYGKLRYLMATGIIFLFRQENTVYMLIPEKFKELYKLIDQKSFTKRHKCIDDVHQYILAMTNLYGAFHSTLAFETYNQQNKYKLNYEDYADIIFRLENRQQYFYISHGNIICEYYELPEMEEELEQMLRQRKGKPFFIPEKSELLKYADNLYEFKTPEFLALDNFVHTKLNLERNKAQNLLDDIRYLCSMGESIKNIMEEVNKQDVVFEGMDQVNEFLQLVNELSNNSRLWVNGGHTPTEIFEKYEKPHLRPLPKEPFVINPQQVQSDKVGRNEPCPCGSGKKYKKCCGQG